MQNVIENHTDVAHKEKLLPTAAESEGEFV